ncbi:putative hydro-lyase [Robbsia sp. KACC 23696]|uniref:putative hydro-lyase n=1 Tax=Robbsia sp. KACC 23696 TaxID=3149231 RepID=UPI00325C2D82
MHIHATPAAFRQVVRSNAFDVPTPGQCPGYVQGNLAILPKTLADDFLRFARLNPKACPVIGMTEPGDPRVPELGDVDLMHDAPMYCIFENGKQVGEVRDLKEVWRDDLVGFVLGCSFSFEEPLVQAGIPLRHIEQGTTVPVYRTAIPNKQAGPFGGSMVVSMRPMTAAHAIRAVQITSRMPGVHGAPVHLGDPSLIGISDIDRPDWGDVAEIRPGEIPVFWACGVTPQEAIRSAQPSFAITHKPGHMVITDLKTADLAIL